MAGTYNGPDMWGGGATWWEQVTGTSHESSAIYRANKEANSFYIPLPGSGAGTAVVETRGGAVVTRGPGEASVGAAPTGGPGVVRVGKPVGSGPGNGRLLTGWFGKPEEVTQAYIGGFALPRDPNTSDAQEIEDAHGEGEFLSPGWFYNWAKELANYGYAYTKAIEPQVSPGILTQEGRAKAQTLFGDKDIISIGRDWIDANNSQPLPTFPSAGYGW